MRTRLLLARHAAHADVGRLLSGRGDAAGLTDDGRDQARHLGFRLRNERPAALHASPRRRAAETAAILAEALGLVAQPEPALDEIDFGVWTGRDFALLDEDSDWHSWNRQRATAAPPGGEAMQDAASRALNWTRRLPALHPDETVLAVSHADIIKALLLTHLGASLDSHWRMEVAPASLSALELWPGGGRVLFVNETFAGPGVAA